MSYNIEFRPEAFKDLEGLDRVIAQRILDKLKWFVENFDSIAPQALTGDLKGFYKLRVGDYRVIYSLKLSEALITIHLIGHRKEVYHID